MENIYTFLKQKMMHTTDQALELLDKVLETIYNNPDKFSLSLSDLDSEDPFVFLHILYEDIIKGIVGKINMEEIVSMITDKNLVIYKFPESQDVDGYIYIELTSMLESTDDVSYLETLYAITQGVIDMDEKGDRLLNREAEDNFENWSFNSLDSETKAIIYDYQILKSETKNILNSYDIDDELYAKVYDWLDYNADVDGFSLTYDKDSLEKFLQNL